MPERVAVASHCSPVVVENGPVPETFATGVLPIEWNCHFARVTFCDDHPWGGPHGPERHVKHRIVLTADAIDALMQELLRAKGRLSS